MQSLGMVLLGLMAVVLAACGGNGENEDVVVVYTSVDRVYSEPVLQRFEQETGIRVLARYDIEASKTTGLVNRLLSEARSTVIADVFWNGEFAQTLLLKEQGVLAPCPQILVASTRSGLRDPDGCWIAFGGRARVLLVNTELLAPDSYPSAIHDLADDRYPADRVAIARPVFGTTATHAAALYATWGEERARAFFRLLQQRGVRVVEGNSMVRDLVASGEILFGLTDTDDALAALRRGAPVTMIAPDQDSAGTLVVPNTAALLNGAPHAENAGRLIAFLVDRHTQQQLVASGWTQIAPDNTGRPLLAGEPIVAIDVGLDQVYRRIRQAKVELGELFVQ